MTPLLQEPVVFGGPDRPARVLRDLLQAEIDASPRGSRIDWATYYFRDRALASSLIAASERGVAVTLALEARPRRRGANDAVIAMLAAHGLSGGLRLVRSGPLQPGHLHSKIYAFSHSGRAWVGSFNPSGDDPEDPHVIAEIGDQDRGHNLLVALTHPKLTGALVAEVARLGRSRSRWAARFDPAAARVVKTGDTWLRVFPRLDARPIERAIEALRQTDRVRAAISHLKPGRFATVLERAAARGVIVDLLVHDTERRVPTALVDRFSARGVMIRRVSDPERLPMHAKFLLIDRGTQGSAWFGSYNFNGKSRLLNAETLVRTIDPAIVGALDRRFAEIAAMVSR